MVKGDVTSDVLHARVCEKAAARTRRPLASPTVSQASTMTGDDTV